MKAHARALGAVCCVLAAAAMVGAESHAGAYGKECSDDTACSGTAPICAVFFEDFSARVRPLVPRVRRCRAQRAAHQRKTRRSPAPACAPADPALGS